jgi:hypothetical protein
MLSFLKKIFGAKPAEVAPAPYKVEKPTEFPFPSTKPVKSEKKTAEKKPGARRPRKPKAPKA